MPRADCISKRFPREKRLQPPIRKQPENHRKRRLPRNHHRVGQPWEDCPNDRPQRHDSLHLPPHGRDGAVGFSGAYRKVGYDGWGRKTSLFDPSAGSYSYRYDLFGQLEYEEAPLGTTDYEYDDYGKLEKKTQKGRATHLITDYDYDPETKLIKTQTTEDKQENDTYTYEYEYDTHERLEKVSETNAYASFSQTLGYDDLGRLATEDRTVIGGNTQQTVNVKHGYAANGQLTTLKDETKTLWTLKEDNARGQATRIQLRNGIVKTRNYDPLGYLDSLTDSNTLSLAYTYDKQKGTMTSRHHKGHDQEIFTHDQRSRLTQIVQGGKRTFTQEYDGLGRIHKNSKVGQYNCHTLNKAPNRYATKGFTMNASGLAYYREHWRQEMTINMDRKTLTAKITDHGEASFVYDAQMNRIHAWYSAEEKQEEEVVSLYRYRKHYATIFPAEIKINEDTDATVITQYLGGDAYTAPVIKQNNQYRYLHRDHLGSILAITDDLSRVLEKRHFGAWGMVESFTKNGKRLIFQRPY